MKYLDAVFKETLRKYPVVLWLSRTAMVPYTFSGTKVTIPKGQHVVVPVDAIHNDPDIFSKPEIFDPNRFLDDNDKNRHPMFYIPFGDGPRNCIGARFAKIQSKRLKTTDIFATNTRSIFKNDKGLDIQQEESFRTKL